MYYVLLYVELNIFLIERNFFFFNREVGGNVCSRKIVWEKVINIFIIFLCVRFCAKDCMYFDLCYVFYLNI